ncbi:MAG: GNAT family N-acetyltransferase [Syntrophomonas sp.]
MRLTEEAFSSIEDIWDDLYQNNSHISPYMSYSFQKTYKRYLWLGSKRFGMQYLCYVVYDGAEAIAIIPLIRRRNDYYLAGDLCATGYLDCIYSDQITDRQMEEIEKLLKEKAGAGTKFHLNKLNQSSLLMQHYASRVSPERATCVSISLPDSYDDYFASLSKSVRQNVRTAKNRMQREGKEWNVETTVGVPVSWSLSKQLLEVYNKRLEKRDGKKVGAITRYVREHFNPITLAASHMKDNIVSILYIDGRIAAFMMGLIDNRERTALIPRLAIDSDYSVYCPGFLLVCEASRFLIAHTQVRNLDLSRGDEQYKYSLGGTEHFNYSIVL